MECEVFESACVAVKYCNRIAQMVQEGWVLALLLYFRGRYLYNNTFFCLVGAAFLSH